VPIGFDYDPFLAILDRYLIDNLMHNSQQFEERTGFYMSYGKILMEDGETDVSIELDEAENYRGPLGVTDDLKKKFSEIMGLVEQTAKNAHVGYMKIPPEVRPKELELSFGIKLNAEKGLLFSKVGCEGSFQVTLRWSKD
jgi:hypothetical protein